MQISMGDEPAATVTPADAPVTLETRGGTLYVEASDEATMEDPVMVDVVTDDLEELDVTGDALVYLDDIEGDDLDLMIDGDGRVEGTGRVEDLDIEVTGAGEVALFALTAEDVDIDIEGSGSVEVTATGDLDIDIEGDGTVVYDGSPDDVDVDGPQEQVSAR